MNAVQEPPKMAKKPGRPRRSERDDVAVKVDRAIIAKARFAAETRGIPLAELLSDLLRTPVEQEFNKALRQAKDGQGKS